MSDAIESLQASGDEISLKLNGMWYILWHPGDGIRDYRIGPGIGFRVNRDDGGYSIRRTVFAGTPHI